MGRVPVNVEQALSWVDQLYTVIANRRGEVDRFDRYYRGEHRLVMASDQWRRFHEARYKNFADNWCGVVADAPAQRLRVAGLRLDDDTGTLSAAERMLWTDWLRNDMPRQQAQGVLETLKSRRSAVLVWGDNDGPVMTWEDPSQVAVAYDPELPGRRLAALKTWVDGSLEYATLYLPDELWRFERPFHKETSDLIGDSVLWRNDGEWTPREMRSEPNPKPHPLGVVPMVEVRNRGPLRGQPLSEIGGVVPMQDAINLLWAYLFASADHASFPARVVLGGQKPQIPKYDNSGNIVGHIDADLEALANGRMLFLNGAGGEAKIDQWDSAKLDVFTDVIETAVGHIAAQTRTPQHYLILGRNANPAAAEALTAAEAGLNAKVDDLKLFLGSDVREIFRLAALVRGQRGLAELVAAGSTVWEDSENRSEAQRADAAQKWRAIGMPKQALVEKYWSNDPVEVERVMAMSEAEQDDPTMARIMREFRADEPVAADAASGE